MSEAQRVVVFEGQTHIFPADATDQEIAQALGAPPDTARGGDKARTWTDTARDVAVGAAKGAGNTAVGFGDLAYRYVPGVGRLSDAVQRPIASAFQVMTGASPEARAANAQMPRVPAAPQFAAARQDMTPTNTPQKVGFGAEQMAEFFAPTGALGKMALPADVAKSGVLTLAQGGSPTAAGVSAGLTAALPMGAGLVNGASGALKKSAEKDMAQALGATKEWAKSDAAKLAPQMLARGVRGSRATMLARAQDEARSVGSALTDAYQTAAKEGATVPSDLIQGHIQAAARALKVTDATGAARVIPGTERVIAKMDDLAEFVGSLGPDIPVDKAAQIKRTWDQVVSKAGLYGPKATASATDSADAWAIREAAGSFRDLLNANPTIADLNQEAAFWTKLKNVLRETGKRTQSQRGSLTDAVRGTAGAVAGATMGGPVGAGVGTVAGQTLSKILASPAWKTTVTAPMKNALADALASGQADRIASAMGKIAAAMPTEVRLATAQ